MQQISVVAMLTGGVVLLSGYILPWLFRYQVLLGSNRVWSPDPKFADLKNTCMALYPLQLQGCEKFKLVGRNIFAACVGDWTKRRMWFPPMGIFDEKNEVLGIIRDTLYKIDIQTRKLTELSLQNFPAETDFCVHGMDVIETTPGGFSMFLVNHRREGSVIEKFKYTDDSRDVFHVSTFDGTDIGLYNPNDIFALPVSNTDEESTESAFFVTNDQYFRRSKIGRTLEKYFRLPTGSLFYHSASTGFHRVKRGISNANGITGFQNEEFRHLNPHLANVIFVASILDGMVTAYRYEPGRVIEKNGLVKLKDYSFDFVMDNLAISRDSRWLYLAGHGQPAKLGDHWETPGKVSSASISYRMSLTELGEYFGNKGEIGESRVERIVVDKNGVLGNASTTAVGDDQINKYWISGLTFKGKKPG
ncbi:Serum paraoxonase/arylesterase 2, variant 4 [Orbilia ellipsospora]|uniref:Serum paraoxonase/arylesterase 2, variant 4 n=2 Tax=Orbilia ellipsospora TaxID=2528407 RepID=A0AAV9XGW4_9PEZI